jgi:hypothetical protein
MNQHPVRVSDIKDASDVNELSDFTGTMKELRDLIDRLTIKYGADAYIQFDAGSNNVSCYVATAHQLRLHLEVLINKERQSKQKRRTLIRNKIAELERELDDIKE